MNEITATDQELLAQAKARIHDLENILKASREYGDEHRLRADRLQALYDDAQAELASAAQKREHLKARLGYEESQVNILNETILARELEIADLTKRLAGDG